MLPPAITTPLGARARRLSRASGVLEGRTGGVFLTAVVVRNTPLGTHQRHFQHAPGRALWLTCPAEPAEVRSGRRSPRAAAAALRGRTVSWRRASMVVNAFDSSEVRLVLEGPPPILSGLKFLISLTNRRNVAV